MSVTPQEIQDILNKIYSSEITPGTKKALGEVVKLISAEVNIASGNTVESGEIDGTDLVINLSDGTNVTVDVSGLVGSTPAREIVAIDFDFGTFSDGDTVLSTPEIGPGIYNIWGTLGYNSAQTTDDTKTSVMAVEVRNAANSSLQSQPHAVQDNFDTTSNTRLAIEFNITFRVTAAQPASYNLVVLLKDVSKNCTLIPKSGELNVFLEKMNWELVENFT